MDEPILASPPHQPDALGRLVRELTTADGPLPASRLAELLAPIPPEAVARHVAFDPEGRCRRVIHRDADFEVVVIGWLPGQRCEPHDHGPSACAWRGISGVAHERRFVAGPGAPAPTLRHAPGAVSAIQPGEVHDVANPGPEPLVTLHVYSPPLSAPVATPGPRRPHVVVVGGGFSAAALAVHLARGGALDGLRLTVVEPSGGLGRGVAYDANPVHLLNVPAGRMSLLPDAPDHFLDWARRHRPRATADAFLPRALYGDYVEATVAAEVGDAVTVVPTRVVDVHASGDGWEVTLASGGALRADIVVLATGNLPPANPGSLPPSVRRTPHFVPDPWRRGALSAIGADEAVLVLGTGLTMVDVVLALRAQRHRARIVAVSRRGLLPLSHRDPGSAPLPPQLEPGEPLARWIRYLRDLERELPGDGVRAIDGLRRLTPDIWAAWSPADQRAFATHVRPYWDAVRHRLPHEVAQQVRYLGAAGALVVRAGRVVGAEVREGRVEAALRWRRRTGVERWTFDRVIDATGPDTDLARSGGLLYRSLIERGTVAQDRLRLGLLTDADGRALGADGLPRRGLYVLGGARRPRDWESVAVPELRQQAARLAQVFAEALPLACTGARAV